MTATEILYALLKATASSSAALILVLALRRPLRRAFDSGAAYLLWLLVPLAAIAILLPAAILPVASMPTALTRVLVVPASDAFTVLHEHLRAPAAASIACGVLGLWVVGAVLAASLFARRQYHFQRALGRLEALKDGTFVAQTSVGLPAVVGIVRPRIVLPADQAARFDAVQRQLVRVHESVHIERGDQVVNLFALAARCVFWFNPLVHWAAPRLRHDQELACDARVIARHPQARRSYGEALLGTQALLASAPLTCQIGFGHPLRERIAMLKQPVASRPRRIAGFTFALLVVAGAGFAANAARTDAGPPDTMPKVTFMPPLRNFYPAEALARKLTGMVYLKIHVTAEGNVDQVEIDHSDASGVFDSSALEVARQCKFAPATRHGKPVATGLILPVKFTLRKEGDSK